MVDDGKNWWERWELEIQLVALAISLALAAIGLILPDPILVGAGFLGTILSLTYVGYAYVRRLR